MTGEKAGRRLFGGADPGVEGFTGLEASIILIAFVMVAAIFAFTVLGSGYFSTQKAQKTVYTGVEQSTSALTVVGDVYGIGEVRGEMTRVRVTLGTAAGGEGVDLERLSVTVNTEDWVATLRQADPLSTPTAAPGEWCVCAKTGDPAPPLFLSAGDQATLIVVLPAGAGLSGGERLTIEILSPVGAPVTISRTIPPLVSTVTILT
ncbi:hypothetical protein AZH53_10125 [Methanomicrobiaceae archaeon CYW5]|uniref:flagellin n=1 Tax=Methanovulcanius yangii TaxID=1789227 RepID=UPI0029CA0086|nr:flagellin [Methanovulcanius yangii]MBT8508761.1 hypothetical protein [Methanovulcanius yangii]